MLLRQTGGLYKNFNCEVSIFGHMHTGMILSAKGINYENEKLFLGVPSTSSLNIGNAVGYLLYIYPEDNSMEVSVLFSDGNLNIYEKERFVWCLGGENKFYKREYKRR